MRCNEFHMTISALSYQHVSPELRVFHGADSLNALRRELERQGCGRAVVVCGQTVSRSDAMQLLRKTLGPILVDVVPAVKQHSPVSSVEDAAQRLKETQADSVIAVGGGSAAVTARAAAILLGEGAPLSTLCTRRSPEGRFESPRLNAPKLAQFVVPTTPSTAFVKAGTAVHDADGQRLAMFDPKTRAKAIVVHPAFLETAPEDLVRSASLNAFANAVEALESAPDPLSEALLLQALRLMARHLGGIREGGLPVRERLVVAAILCGRGTEQGGTGLASVLAHAIGRRSHVANGIVNAVVLPHTMRYNAPVTLERTVAIAQALAESSVSGNVLPAASEAVDSFLAGMQTPRTLQAIGVPWEHIEEIATAAMSDWFIGRNPRKVPDLATLVHLLQNAWKE
jgi:alcohol dehydrogenase class IV